MQTEKVGDGVPNKSEAGNGFKEYVFQHIQRELIMCEFFFYHLIPSTFHHISQLCGSSEIRLRDIKVAQSTGMAVPRFLLSIYSERNGRRRNHFFR